MLIDMASLSFQAHANYGTWSIDFDYLSKIIINNDTHRKKTDFYIINSIQFLDKQKSLITF